MKRLTKKNDKGLGSWTQLGDQYIPAHNIKHKQCVNKLGELEDIEELLGIDLITLFKAFNCIAYKKDNEIKTSCHIAITDWKIHILEETVINNENFSLNIKDYGKTWALTKEELECHDM